MELEPEVFQFLVKLQRLVLLKVKITHCTGEANIEFGSWVLYSLMNGPCSSEHHFPPGNENTFTDPNTSFDPSLMARSPCSTNVYCGCGVHIHCSQVSYLL